MSWTAFHFSCRFLSQKLSDGLELKPALDLLSKNYGNHQPSDTVDNPIYKDIASEEKQSKQQELLAIYGNLKLNWDASSVTKLTSIRNYLFLIFGVFILLSSVYKVFVLPAFKEVFSSMDIPINAQLESFTMYWVISLLLMTIVSAIILKFSSLIKQINGISTTFSSSAISRLLISKKIVNQIQKIEALIHAPLGKNVNQFSASENEFIKQLSSDDMNVAKELQALIDAQYSLLTTMINGRIKKMVFLLAFIVVSAIFNFIYSLYAPIFSIGTII
tara:strand:+ start:1190 stop:2014 length:825 start_codon:yes stop_codon:yes gene_type:complete